MIDYIPPDIPPAIVEYEHNRHSNLPKDVSGYWFKYMTVWKGNLELYFADLAYNPLEPDPKTGESQYRKIGLPNVLIYDCHDVRRPTITEIHDIHWFMPKYITQGSVKSEHLCHRDLEAFNQHNTPNPYKQKVKYFTPKYIPKPVVEYINEIFTISWQPGTNERYVKYLTTYENKYEVYFVYWKDAKSHKQSQGKYILYDCKNAREYQNNKERMELMDLKSYEERYNSAAKPTFCSTKYK